MVKNLPANAGGIKRHGFDSWVGKIPWRREWQPTVFLPGEFQGQRSLVGCGPWGCKELDVTEHLSTCKKYISDYLLSIQSPVRSPAQVHALLSFLSDVDSLQGCAPGTSSASTQAGLLPPSQASTAAVGSRDTCAVRHLSFSSRSPSAGNHFPPSHVSWPVLV